MKKLFILPIFILAIYACTEKTVTIPEFEIPDTDRVVLIEEFTGVACPNCPKGSAEVASIMETFSGKVVAVGIHSDFLAAPLPESVFDFRNDLANDLEAYLWPYDGKPAASINRRHFDNESNLLIDVTDKWFALVQQELTNAPKVEIQIKNEFDADTRTLNSKIDISPLENISGEFTLTVYITESHIIDYQKNQTTTIPEFEHEHVLKVKLNENLKGDALEDNFTIGNLVSRTYSYTLPEADISGPWVPENCSVIAFVSEITSDTKEVLQAAEAHVVE